MSETEKKAQAHFWNGHMLRRQGLLKESCSSFQQAYGTLSGDDPDYAKGSLANEYGLALIKVGEYEQAKTVIRQALEHNRSAGDRMGEAVSLLNLGDAYSRSGDRSEAIQYWKNCLDIAHNIDHPQLAQAVQHRLGK